MREIPLKQTGTYRNATNGAKIKNRKNSDLEVCRRPPPQPYPPLPSSSITNDKMAAINNSWILSAHST
jgi:hypothetical protein